MEKKVTKKNYFNAIRSIVETVDVVGDYPANDVLAFIDKQIQQLNTKAKKARQNAEKRRAAGDELRERIKGLLTNDFQTADEITEAFEDEEITKAKVVARLGQLVKINEAEKKQVKAEDGRKLMAYRIFTGESDSEED